MNIAADLDASLALLTPVWIVRGLCIPNGNQFPPVSDATGHQSSRDPLLCCWQFLFKTCVLKRERVTRVASPLPEPRIVRATASVRPRPAVRQAVLKYRVRRGQTPSHVARHKVAVRTVRKASRLGKAGRPHVGQALRVVRATESET